MNSFPNPRFQALKEVSRRTPLSVNVPMGTSLRPQSVTEYFGKNTFNATRMREKLSREIYEKLLKTIEEGHPLDADIADSVAGAVREWATENGATHFCHWFQPQTGMTAEKHDAFLTLDKNKNPVEKLTGSQLIQSEPDASSFPSGGMRATFEARGYTAWDPSSPIFIMEVAQTKTLCIPSAFVSYHGDALDQKTGLLRSIEAISRRATELLHLIGETKARRVVPTLGCEQEYFLIDRAYYNLRPDIIMSTRSLLGRPPTKHQQLEDHYFGSIAPRVQAFMGDVEVELYKLGVPIKTRHNEVAPSQFEVAPIFEEANVAVDHNQLTMTMLKKTAKKHDFELLLHEKPFAGVNGSGKHCNWSLTVTASGEGEDGSNLLEPGKTPYQNLRFLLFLAATLKGVKKHAGLLRAGIASPGNDHRLGANEAPPAIMSVFLGDLLSKIMDQLAAGQTGGNSEEAVLRLGVSKLPVVARDNTDRNRTSPFAFTGNKFEFRAVGSSASPAWPVTLLNAAICDGIEEITKTLRARLKSGTSLEAAILETLKEAANETKAIRFEGNGYSDDWVKEAEKRGLLNLRKTPEALAQLVTPQSKELLSRLEIFSEPEIVSRYHVNMEHYLKVMRIEAETLSGLIQTHVLPAAYRYHTELLEGVSLGKATGRTVPQIKTLDVLTERIEALQRLEQDLVGLVESVQKTEDHAKAAVVMATQLAPKMADLRGVADDLEGLIPDAWWPLPKYSEMLFVY